MHFVQDGPDIPERVIQAHEDGQLLFFCGAGISMPAGLPSFKRLVESVYERTGAAWKKDEKREFCRQNYDRTLGLLERPGRLGRDKVRRALYQELQPGNDPDLSTHEALLNLAEAASGKRRLVTTNFDRLFEQAGESIHYAAAPRLPTPKPYKWSGLVYLHGRLGDSPDSNENLVLTSGDFGVAYLTERWASRFVTELFRHYTVLFVGYSIGDPVLRYMVDAFSAEQQRRGEEAYSAYAFAAHGDGKTEEVRQRWEAKRIKPILYDKEGGHHRLHDTLQRWAEIWKGGLTTKQNLVTSRGKTPPELLSEEEIKLVTWALSDPSGAPARAFRKLGADAPIAWLPVLWENGLLGDPDDADASPPIVARRSLRSTRTQLPKPQEELARWILNHLSSERLVDWVVKKGGHLHPRVEELIRLKLDNEESALPEAYEKIWRLFIAEDEPICETDKGFRPFDRFREDSWGPALQSDFLSLLEPCLDPSPTRVWDDFEGLELNGSEDEVETDSASPSEMTIRDLIKVDCEVRAGQDAQFLVDCVRDREDWDSVLEDTWFDLAKLLRRAVDLQKRTGAADDYSDPSYVEHPSIRPSDQNNYFSGWTHLIDLCREAIDNLCPPLLQKLLWEWQDSPVCRRLALYYFLQCGAPEVGTLLSAFQENPNLWVWCNPLRAELYPALPQIWDKCDEEEKHELADVLVEGPPRDKYIDALDSDEWEYRKDRTIWNRLIRIQSRSEDRLTESAQDTLTEIEDKHPDWTLEGTEKERLARWSETRWGYRTDFSTEDLLENSNEELAQVLVEHDEHREGLMEAWRNVVIQSPERSLNVLDRLDEVSDVPSDIWEEALRGMSETDFEVGVHSRFLRLINGRPDRDLQRAIHPASRFAEYIAPEVVPSDRDAYLSYWDRLFPLARDKEIRDGRDCVEIAINHPLGKLAGSLMRRARADVGNGSTSLEDDIRNRVEQLLGLEEAAGIVAAVVCSRLSLLFSIAPEWTEEHVIPRLRWENGDLKVAKCGWQGYLWGASIGPSLWPKIKPHYLDTLDHLDRFTDQNIRNLAQLLAIVSIEFPEGLGTDEAREHLRPLGSTGRVAVARWVGSRLDGAGERAPTLWREEISPWIQEAWPPENQHHGSEESIALSQAAINAGEAFPDAVDDVRSFLVSVDRIGHVVHPLLEEGFPQRYPQSSLHLLSELIGENTIGYSRIGECLNQIRDAAPEVTDDSEFERLREMGIRNGWLDD